MALKTVSLDFEFRRSNEPTMQLVCAATKVSGETFKHDLRTDEGTKKLKKYLDKQISEGRVILCYFGSAETRAMLSMGYTPTQLLDAHWLDLFVPWRMLTHSHPDFRWGRQWDKKWNRWTKTEKPPFGESSTDEWEEGDDGEMVVKPAKAKYRPCGIGMADAIAHRLGINIDTDHKDEMRDLILKQDSWTDEEFNQIADYCASDVEYLLDLAKVLIKDYRNITGLGYDKLIQMSKYSVCMGIAESYGIPVDKQKMDNLSANFLAVDRAVVDECNAVYPFYKIVKPAKKDREKGWGDSKPQESDAVWASFLESAGLLKDFPKSAKTGKPARTKEVLEDYEGHEAIAAYAMARKARKQLQYLSPWAYSRIQGNIGSDSCIRTLLGPFGTKTGRNAPSVKNGYIFAMSSWLRPLISAPEGEVILGADFSAQEIALQGWVANDDAYLDAYASGDPYTWLAQTAGIMREDVYRDADGKFRLKDTDEKIEGAEADELKNQRNLTKALLLGIGFGMGYDKLGRQLSMAKLRGLSKERKAIVRAALMPDTPPELREQGLDIIEECTVYATTKEAPIGTSEDALASTYKGLHMKIFHTYWDWRTQIIRDYETDGYLDLPDGWCLMEGEDRPNTVANFRVQGLGATILRRAFELCIRAGLKVIAPLHDAIYIRCKIEDKEEHGRILCECMRQAVGEFTGDDQLIRIDWEEYHTDWEGLKSTWTKDKGGFEFSKFGKYMVEGPKKPMTIADLPKIEFDAETHKYWLNGVQLKTSVSGVLERIKKPFDAVGVSLRKCFGNAEKAFKLREEWDLNRDIAALKGTISHFMLEYFIHKHIGKGEYTLEEATAEIVALKADPLFPEGKRLADAAVKELFKAAQKWIRDGGYELAGTEIRMAYEPSLLGGTCDILLRRNGKYRLADWKTNKDLDKPAFGNFLHPAFSSMPTSKINGYALQMSLYRVMLEKQGIGPWEDEHTIMWGSDGQARIIQVPHYPEAEQLLYV